MGYGVKIYQEAVAQLKQRKAIAEQRAQRGLQEFYKKCPEAQRIKEETASNAARIARAVMSGGDAKAALEQIKENGLALNRRFSQLLTEHGYSQEDITPQYTCPLCQDSGFVDGRLCSCLQSLQKKLAYERLSMSVPLSNSTFSAFSLDYYEEDQRAYQQMKMVLNTCKQYASLFRANSPSFLFKGGNGLGKTHLALAIANIAIEKGFGVIYGSSQNFAVSLEKERFQSVDPDKAEDTNSQLLSCDLLILDDLGTEFSSSYVAAALYNVIDTRIMMAKPTIITTNLSLADMEKRYGQRFASRVNGCYNKLEFLGSDIRNLRRKRKINQSGREGQDEQ